MVTIKMVADVNDSKTKLVLKHYWNSCTPTIREKILDRGGFSNKWIESSFDELTPAIQQILIISKKQIYNNW